MHNNPEVFEAAMAALRANRIPASEKFLDTVSTCPRSCFVDYHNPEFGFYSFFLDPQRKMVYEGQLLVHTEGKGHGTRLVHFSEDLCTRLGVELILVNRNFNNPFWSEKMHYTRLDRDMMLALRETYPNLKFIQPVFKPLKPFDMRQWTVEHTLVDFYK